jgi:hypothetical protein
LSRFVKILAGRGKNENLNNRGMQTFRLAHKTKEVQASGASFANADTMANAWIIHDAYVGREKDRSDMYVTLIRSDLRLIFSLNSLSICFSDDGANKKSVSQGIDLGVLDPLLAGPAAAVHESKGGDLHSASTLQLSCS